MVSICIGKQGTGKTTFTKQMLEINPLPVVIYDVNQEYTEFYNEPFIDFVGFMDKIKELKSHYIIIEEATIFFSPKARTEDLINLMVRHRHMKNNIQLNFHSFASVPIYIKDLVQFITIFKTNDNEKKVRERVDRDSIVDEWVRINKSKNPFEHATLKMQ
jgi:hypothetical protein